MRSIHSKKGDKIIDSDISVKEDDIEKAFNTVTAISNNEVWGIVSGEGKKLIGENVRLEAIAMDNCKFVGWYQNDELFSEEKVLAFNAVDNITLTAVFEPCEEIFVYGDADADNVITASDAAFILQKTLVSTFELPIEKKTDDWLKYADVDDDTYITASDAAFILQKTLVSNFELPAEKRYQ